MAEMIESFEVKEGMVGSVEMTGVVEKVEIVAGMVERLEILAGMVEIVGVIVEKMERARIMITTD